MDIAKQSPIPLEFSEGEIFPMATPTPQHAALARHLVRLCGTLPADASFLPPDVKVRVDATDLTTYPDVTLVRGARVHSPKDPEAVTNPAVVVEITSPATEEFDCGDKLRQYQQLPSVEAVLLVSHRLEQVTVVRRTDGMWVAQEFRSGERLPFAAGIDIDVDQLYADIHVTG